MNGNYKIRHAEIKDLDVIMKIYESAKKYMNETGNPNQWNDGYPEREILINDMEKKQCFVYEENDVVHGVFVFIIGEDPTYNIIEDGEWLNDEPYGTIHRIASDGKCRGVFSKCMQFCTGKIDNIRIDTHHDNVIMQTLVEKQGFIKCGIIYVRNHSPRIAYMKKN